MLYKMLDSEARSLSKMPMTYICAYCQRKHIVKYRNSAGMHRCTGHVSYYILIFSFRTQVY
jgi:hypothetical protein